MATIEVNRPAQTSSRRELRNHIKVTIPIDGGQLPRDILPPEGAPGSAKALVSFEVKAGEMVLTVSVKAKTYREVLSKVDASEHGAFAVLQGKLGVGVLNEAGFAVQVKVLKAEKVADSAEGG